MKTFYTFSRLGMLVMLMVIAGKSRGQAPVVVWDKAILESPPNTIPSAQSIQKTTDGGYILLANYSQILKLDGNGVLQWQKVYQGEAKKYYTINTVQQTTDGGYIVAGQFRDDEVGKSAADGRFGNALIIKLNDKGETQWEKVIAGVQIQINVYGATVSLGYSASSAFQTTDGGYIVGISNLAWAGIQSDKDAPEARRVRVLKLDASGNTQWLKVYENPRDYIFFVRQTKDNGYIVLFNPDEPEERDVLNILKLDNAGNLIWKKAITSLPPFTTQIHQTPDGGYILGSQLYRPQGVGIVKLNEAGDVQWEKLSRERREYFGALNITLDDGFIFTYGENDPILNDYFKKLDKDGNTLWQLSNFNIQTSAIQQTSEKEYIAAGIKRVGNTTTWELRMVKLIACSLTATASNTGPYMEGSSIQLSANGTGTYAWTGPQGFTSTAQNPVIPNATVAHSGTYRVTVTGADNCKAEASTEVRVDAPLATEPRAANWLQAFPNPARGHIQVKVPYDGQSRALLYSADGRLMKQTDFTRSTSLNTQNLSPGIYPLRVVNGNREAIIKVMVE